MTLSRPHPLRSPRVLLAATVLASLPLHTLQAQTTAPAAHRAHRHHAAPHAKAGASAHATTGTIAAPGATASIAAPGPALSPARAALPAGFAPRTEEVTVTGSAIGTARNTSPNPVQIVTAVQIQRTGATTLGDFLQRLPSVGSSGTYNTATNGGGGASCTDLRNLGAGRTLVLIDDKRTTPVPLNNCVDLNSIPIQQIASVEILKDGGSELYGADAVAGVINIKLRHDIDTGNITVRGNITGHGDNEGGILSAMKGFNFDHGRGNLTLFGSYMTQGGVMQRDRGWANPAWSGLLANSVGSSLTQYGTFQGVRNNAVYSSNLNGQLVRGRNPSRYLYGYRQSLLNQLQVSSLSGDTHYDLNEHFTLYSQVLYSHRSSSTFLAPVPYSGTPNTIVLPTNYPGNTSGQPLYYVSDRFTELGDRRTTTAVDTVTGMFGTKGLITHNWLYDLSYTYGSSQQAIQTRGVGSYTNMLNAFGLVPSNPGNLTDTNTTFAYNPGLCAGTPGCVSASPFGTLSPQAANYANYNSISHYTYLLRDLNLRIHNNHVVHMPWEHGGSLGIALGMEHRGEQLSYHPDAQVALGNTFGNRSLPTSGGFNVTEGYLEGQLPLLRNAFLARDLTIDAQGRYSSYNTFGNAKNWKVGIDWAPTQDIRFRGTLGTSFRQPSVYNLYQGQALGYPSAVDPCGQATARVYGAAAPTVVARCAAQGINTATFVPSSTSQVPALSGGNPALQPEVGRTYTFGAVLTPRWIPGLSTSWTYWHYTISGLIGSVGAQYVMDSCYTGTNTAQCGNIVRSANGQINSVSVLSQNLGVLITSGYDWDTHYTFRVTDRDAISIDNNFQGLQSYKQQLIPGSQYYNLRNFIYYASGSSQPNIRDYATVGWTHGPFNVSYMMQYTGGVRWISNANVPVTPSSAYRSKTPPMVLQDLQLGYRGKVWNLNGGINNVFNKKPPFLPNGTNNTDAATYAGFVPGRSFFLQAGVNF